MFKNSGARRVSLLTGASALALAMAMTPANAQEQDDEGFFQLEEIIVTATKRATALNDTSIAVSAYTADMRDRIGIQGLQNVADFTPGLTALDGSGVGGKVAIRGVGRLTQSLGSDPGVALYSDGIYTSETAIAGGTTLTVERVEVLRGPQGTLYGRNSVGGAINVISKKPTEEWERHVRMTYGNNDQLFFGGSISGPITDTFRIFVAASHNERDGFNTNLGSGPDAGEKDDFYVMAQFEWDLTDNLELWVKATHYDYNVAPESGVGLTPYSTDVFRGDLVHNPSFGYSEEQPGVNDPRANRTDHDAFVRLDNNFDVTSSLTWSGEDVTVRYLGSYAQYDWSYSRDYDGTDRTDTSTLIDVFGNFGLGSNGFDTITVPNQFIEDIGEEKKYQSHDIQISSNTDGAVEWIVGAYYYKEEIFQPYDLTSPGDPFLTNPYFVDFATLTAFAPAPPNERGSFYYQDGTLDGKAYALYGQVGYEIDEHWKVIGGLRYSKDKKRGLETQRTIYSPLGRLFDPAILASVFAGTYDWSTAINATPWWDYYGADLNGTLTGEHEDSWSKVTGNLIVEYRPNADSLVYASVAKGYKSGGFRLGAITDDPATEEDEGTIAEEGIWAYELGYKTTINDRMQLNLAAYYYKYSDLQTVVPVRRGGINLSDLYNAKDAESYGFEAEVLWQAGDYTTIIGSYAYNHATFTDFCGDTAFMGAAGGDGCLNNWRTGADFAYNPNGNRLASTPKNKFAANATHTIPLENASVDLGVTFSYVGSRYGTVFNAPNELAPSYTRTDFRVAYNDNEDRYNFYFYLRNAFDEDGTISRSESGAPFFTQSAVYGDPRTYGIEMHLNF